MGREDESLIGLGRCRIGVADTLTRHESHFHCSSIDDTYEGCTSTSCAYQCEACRDAGWSMVYYDGFAMFRNVDNGLLMLSQDKE